MSMAIGSVGSMSQVSLAKLHQEMFTRLDQNSDGKIDKTEFAAAGKKQGASETEKLFAQIDTDQDGSISEAESDAFLTKMEEARKSGEPPSAPPPGQDWQAGMLSAMLASMSQGAQGSETSMSLYV